MNNQLSDILRGNYFVIAPSYRKRYLKYEVKNCFYIPVKSTSDTNIFFELASILMLLILYAFLSLYGRKILISDFHRFVLNKDWATNWLLFVFGRVNILWWNGMLELTPYIKALKRLDSTSFLHEDAIKRGTNENTLKFVPFVFTSNKRVRRSNYEYHHSFSYVGLLYNDLDIKTYGTERYLKELDELIELASKDMKLLLNAFAKLPDVNNELCFRIRCYQVRCATFVVLLKKYPSIFESDAFYVAGRELSSKIDQVLTCTYPEFDRLKYKIPYAEFVRRSLNSRYVLDFGSKSFFASVYPRTQALNALGCNIVGMKELFDCLEVMKVGKKT